ncbi:hypothetical protein OAK87_00595 [bacterium]|nr:hypothetical protein [bacterium]
MVLHQLRPLAAFKEMLVQSVLQLISDSLDRPRVDSNEWTTTSATLSSKEGANHQSLMPIARLAGRKQCLIGALLLHVHAAAAIQTSGEPIERKTGLILGGKIARKATIQTAAKSRNHSARFSHRAKRTRAEVCRQHAQRTRQSGVRFSTRQGWENQIMPGLFARM